MSQPLDERTTDALLGGRNVPGEDALSAFVADTLALMAAPAPSAALAELLEHGLVPDTALLPTLPTQRRRWLLPVPLAVGSLLVVGGVFGAATANALPAPAQRIVSDTVGTLTPLHLPKPAKPAKPRPAVVPSEHPTPPAGKPSEPAGPRASGKPSTHPAPGDHQGDGRGVGESHGPAASPPTRGADRSEGHDLHDRSGSDNGPGGDERR